MLHTTQAGQLGRSAANRGVTDDLVGAVGADDHDLLVDKVPSDVLEEVPRRGITPMEVVPTDDDGAVSAELADEFKGQGEHVADPSCAGCRQLAERLERGQLVDIAASLDLADQIDQRASGMASPPRWTQRPRYSGVPLRRAASAIRADLPIPGSPLTSSTPG